MIFEIGDPKLGYPALARAEQFAAAAEPEILLGDTKAVVGLAQHPDSRSRRVAEGSGIKQQASSFIAAPADSPAKLVKLGKTEPLGPLDHHNRCLGDVDPDLDHRGRHQDSGVAVDEALHRRVAIIAFHLTVDEIDPAAEYLPEGRKAFLRRRKVDRFGLADQRANPIDLRFACQGTAARPG